MVVRKRNPSPEKIAEMQNSAEKRREREQKKKEKEERRKKEQEEEKKKKDPKYKARLKIHELARNFKPYDRNDDYRVPDACKDGGFELTDPVIIGKYRDAAKNIISQMGR